MVESQGLPLYIRPCLINGKVMQGLPGKQKTDTLELNDRVNYHNLVPIF